MEDQLIIDKILDGDAHCYSIIMNRYEQKILRYIYNTVKDKELAEDLCQEVFITAYYKLHTYRQQYRLSTWLYTIAHNKCLDHLRKNKNKVEVSTEKIIEGGLDFVSSIETPESFLELKETRKMVESFVKSLNTVDRSILALRGSEEKLTFYEIAEILKMTRTNVKRRYYKVLEKYESYREKYGNSINNEVI